jgi:hypothetical protein
MANRPNNSHTSLTLKVVGIVCILSFFIDFLILMLGFNFTDKQAQVGLTTALVDRGVVPMVGLAMILIAHWLDTNDQGKNPGMDFKFASLILSSVFGLMFLLIFPLHVTTVNQVSKEKVNQIAQDAQQAESQLNTQLAQFQGQLNNDQGRAQLQQAQIQAKAQITEILKDPQKYKQALANPQLPPEQKELLKKLQANPQDIDKFIAQQTDPNEIAKQKIEQIRQRQREAETQAKDNAWKSGLRIGIGSLLLSIGYIIIGWNGLKTTSSTRRFNNKENQNLG